MVTAWAAVQDRTQASASAARMMCVRANSLTASLLSTWLLRSPGREEAGSPAHALGPPTYIRRGAISTICSEDFGQAENRGSQRHLWRGLLISPNGKLRLDGLAEHPAEGEEDERGAQADARDDEQAHLREPLDGVAGDGAGEGGDQDERCEQH